MKIEAEGQDFAKFLRTLEQFIQTVKLWNNFSNRILIKLVQCNKLEQLQFKLEKKVLGFRNMLEKL